MKKTYIKPENTVVKFNVEQVICTSIDTVEGGGGVRVGTGGTGSSSIISGEAREVIQVPNAWEEW